MCFSIKLQIIGTTKCCVGSNGPLIKALADTSSPLFSALSTFEVLQKLS